MTVTSIVGVLFVYLLHFTGRDYIWLKGAGIGLMIWVALLGTILTQSRVKLDLTPFDIFITAIAHLIYGLSLAFMAKKFYRLPTDPV